MTENLIKIAHISDLHFGAGGYKDVSDSLAEHLRNHVKPDLVLVTGDLVDTPKVALFEEVHGWLENLNKNLGWVPGQPSRYLVCPGNHDRHTRGNALPWRRAKYEFELVSKPIRPHILTCNGSANSRTVGELALFPSTRALEPDTPHKHSLEKLT